ncbi:MAG: HamA C-terminal domain-containing protein [Methylocystis sp.]|uniref:HamA C-terminal domain-containing protein n=1 Tax=Methylocystis sp. TaxID=1911079 RepID=UPI003DA407E4
MGIYDIMPEPFLERIYSSDVNKLSASICCAGFEVQAWRCAPFAKHLIEWLPEYALAEQELLVNHGNIYVKLSQAAVRVYTSEKYRKRGEAGEIALHAICRQFFGTIPICPRVFYKTASNDVVKSFDLVHARACDGQPIELWLGESKLYQDRADAISEAVKSIRDHLNQGFLTNEKLLLGPQIPLSTPRRDELMALFKPQTRLRTY